MKTPTEKKIIGSRNQLASAVEAFNGDHLGHRRRATETYADPYRYGVRAGKHLVSFEITCYDCADHDDIRGHTGKRAAAGA